MSKKHTPGPWEAIGNRVRSPMSTDEETGGSCGGFLLAEVYGLELTRHTEEAKANARLIAAAPEMLEVLQVCQSVLRIVMFGICVESARDTAAESRWEGIYEFLQEHVESIDAVTAKATGNAVEPV